MRNWTQIVAMERRTIVFLTLYVRNRSTKEAPLATGCRTEKITETIIYMEILLYIIKLFYCTLYYITYNVLYNTYNIIYYCN